MQLKEFFFADLCYSLVTAVLYLLSLRVPEKWSTLINRINALEGFAAVPRPAINSDTLKTRNQHSAISVLGTRRIYQPEIGRGRAQQSPLPAFIYAIEYHIIYEVQVGGVHARY